MPDAPSYLVEWLDELGWCQAGAMGPTSLAASEIKAWADMTLRHLAPWEYCALKDASRSYIAYLHDESASPPDGQEIERPSMLSKLKSIASRINKT